MATQSSYLRYRQWINCQGGGYLEDYNLNPILGGAPVASTQKVLNAVKSIFCLRGQLLDGNSGIANGEISIETIPGMNPPEGFQIPHSFPVTNPVTKYYPIEMNDPTSGMLETVINVAQDPGTAIGWRLDTQNFFTELRTLRSLRSTWVQQWGVLLPQLVNALGNLGVTPPTAGNLYTSFSPLGANSTNPAWCIAYYMLVVLVNTALVQYYPNRSSVTAFTVTPYGLPNTATSPQTVNPLISQQLTYRKIGEGWPKIHGKMQSFGTHG